MLVRKSQVRKFVWLIPKSQICKFIQNTAQLCLKKFQKSSFYTIFYE
jgi:hypothetical protein